MAQTFVYKGKRYQLQDAIQAHLNGYFTPDEYLVAREWESRRNEKGLYVPEMVFVNGVYKGVTRQGEKKFETFERLHLLDNE